MVKSFNFPGQLFVCDAELEGCAGDVEGHEHHDTSLRLSIPHTQVSIIIFLPPTVSHTNTSEIACQLLKHFYY